MKLLLKFILITSLLFVINSCIKESSDLVLSENEKKFGTITERGLEDPVFPKKCQCWYEILSFESISHDKNSYVLKGETEDGVCEACQNVVFRANHNCGIGPVAPCMNFHEDLLPDGLFDFNCWLNWDSDFSVSFGLGCCPDDLNCINGPDLFEGKIKYKIHCKRVGKISDNPPQDGFGSSGCDEVLTSDIIVQHNNIFEFEDVAEIELTGECGCQPTGM